MLIRNILLKGHITWKPFFNVQALQSQYLIPNIIRSYSNDSNMSKRALVFLAPGYEELEAIASIDILRRAGICVCIAGLPDKNPVKSARDVEVTPGIGICDVANTTPYDVMVLPGGLGCAKALSECKEVGKLLKDQECNGRKIAAICASPTVLKAHCIATGKKVTSYPAMAAAMKEGGTYDYQEDDVVVDGNIITSRGPGTAAAFGLTIVKELLGVEKACEIAKAMLIKF